MRASKFIPLIVMLLTLCCKCSGIFKTDIYIENQSGSQIKIDRFLKHELTQSIIIENGKRLFLGSRSGRGLRISTSISFQGGILSDSIILTLNNKVFSFKNRVVNDNINISYDDKRNILNGNNYSPVFTTKTKCRWETEAIFFIDENTFK